MATLPQGWREGHEGEAICPHRDMSVCRECATRPEIVDVYGKHYWIDDAEERDALQREMAEAV